jgi:hypothetical protein
VVARGERTRVGDLDPAYDTELMAGWDRTPVDDVPNAARPEAPPPGAPAAPHRSAISDPEVAEQWAHAHAGPGGELYGARGEVIGHIDLDGRMTTLDGQPITGYGPVVNGRHTRIRTGDGTIHGNPDTRPPPEPGQPHPEIDADALAEQARQNHLREQADAEAAAARELARQQLDDAPTGRINE